MTDANNMRSYLKLFEAAAPDYVGPKASDTVTYNAEQTKGEITKITATLKAKDSEKYTKLGRNLVRITQLTEELKTLQAETKGDARDMVADLFHAEDAACTRVVDTVGFMFHMTKDPKASASVSYAKVLEELQGHLTPELINILETLKAKHTGAPVQKAAALSATDKAAPQTEESINEGMGDKLKGFFAKLLSTVQQWGKSYDAKLDALKSEMAMSESLEEVSVGTLQRYKDQADDRDTMLATNKIRAAKGSDDFYTQDGRMTNKGPKVAATEGELDELAGFGNGASKALRALEDAAQASGNFVVLDKSDGRSMTLIDRQKKSWKITAEPVEANEDISEDDSCGYRKGDEVMINAPRSEANGQEASFDSYDSETGLFKVYLLGTGFHGYFKAEELKPLRLGPLPD